MSDESRYLFPCICCVDPTRIIRDTAIGPKTNAKSNQNSFVSILSDFLLCLFSLSSRRHSMFRSKILRMLLSLPPRLPSLHIHTPPAALFFFHPPPLPYSNRTHMSNDDTTRQNTLPTPLYFQSAAAAVVVALHQRLRAQQEGVLPLPLQRQPLPLQQPLQLVQLLHLQQFCKIGGVGLV